MKIIKFIFPILFAILYCCKNDNEYLSDKSQKNLNTTKRNYLSINNEINFDYESLTDYYNSQTGIFIRKLNDNDSIETKIKLSNTEKSIIVNSFLKNDFLNLSKEIDCSSWGVQPQLYTSISLWKKKNKHSVTYISTLNNFIFLCPNGKKFLKIKAKIEEIIYSKKEI